MNLLKKIYHFLGSIYFAVTLIATVAFVVIMGTFIESHTESHRYASALTYGNPIFKGLLWLFFINILFSSLRRWPFKRHHIPFLITHCGLLMILSGCLIKSYWGTQGIMLLVEGSGSHAILLPDTYVVKIEKRDPKNPFGTISRIYDPQSGISPFPELDIQVVSYSPNASEKLETWIKGDKLYLTGLPKGWTASHQKTDDVDETAKREYLKNQKPRLLFLQDEVEDIHLFVFGSNGEVQRSLFQNDNLQSMIVYDKGFGGYAVQEQIMTDPAPLSPGLEGLSALFRAYNIPNEQEVAIVEAPITLNHQDIPPSKKIEDNLPRVTLKISQGQQTDLLSLVYNRLESGIKVPGLNGEYLFRFQPKSKNIPYHLRLRNARQINYANSSQPFSFESDLVITERNSGKTVEKTISMNKVHETWEGYRFYLSNISPSTETAVKRVQLAVNHDPAKYFLTYPGGLIVALGSLMLFWRRKK